MLAQLSAARSTNVTFDISHSESAPITTSIFCFYFIVRNHALGTISGPRFQRCAAKIRIESAVTLVCPVTMLLQHVAVVLPHASSTCCCLCSVVMEDNFVFSKLVSTCLPCGYHTVRLSAFSFKLIAVFKPF